MFTRLAAVAAASLAAVFTAYGAVAHEGHDHGASPAPVGKTISPRGQAVSGGFELVAVAREGRLVIYLDRFGTNQPVTDAAIELETPEGPRAAQPIGDGSYLLAASWIAKAGHHELLATVTADDAVEVLTLAVDIPDAKSAETAGSPSSTSAARAALARASTIAEGLKQRLMRNDPAVAVAASSGFLLGFAVMLISRGRRGIAAIAVLAVTVTVLLGTAAFAHGDDHHVHVEQGAALTPPREAGTDLAQRLPDGAIFVPKPTQRLLVLRTVMTESASFRRTVELPGRVIPDPNASGVVQSSVGGRISPPSTGLFPRLGTRVRRGDVLAYVTQPVQAVDVSDMRQRQGELDQQIAIIQRRVERFQKLAVTGAVAQTQLDDALAELIGARDRRMALDRVRREPEELVAPVDGIVAQASAVAGQMASPGAMVFQIIEPTRLWVEALSFDALTTAQDATARLADGRSLALTYQGSGFADRNQAIPVQFAIKGDTIGLRVGQFVTVLAGTDSELTGLALPRASVVRTGNGQDIVYEHTSAERFEARPVRVEPLDGLRVLVAEGVGAGKRVVTQGAELLDQVR